jgi:hypothetical protein
MGTFSLSPGAGQAVATAYGAYAGASPLIEVYSGTVPASAGASLGSAVLLATLTAPSSPLSGVTDIGTAGRANWATIPAATVSTTGTASFFRTYKADGTTVVDQGKAGLSTDSPVPDMVLNTTALTAGSSLSFSSRNTDFPYGP